MENTHAKTHSGYTVEIAQLFRASRAGEADRFQQVVQACISLYTTILVFFFFFGQCETCIFLGSSQVRRIGCYSGMGHVSLTGLVFYLKVTTGFSVFNYSLCLSDFRCIVN